MNSSIFSSECEWKVWTAVLAVLVATEIALRALLPYLSKDIVHIQQIPAIVEQLSESRGTRVLFLGNSITRNGIDIKRFRKQLSQQQEIAVAEIYPDDTAIGEWLYAYLHYIKSPQKRIDELIICFAEDQLQDRATTDVRRLAANYSDWSTMLPLFREKKLSLDQRAEFVLSRFWASFANAERVQKRILDYVIPYYRQTAGVVNSSLANSTGQVGLVPNNPTYCQLQRLVKLLAAQEANLMVFAFPVGKKYKLDPGLEQTLGNYNIPFADLREVPEIGPNNFPDGYHMDEEAAQKMATAVANQVSKVFATRLERASSK